MKNEKNFKKIIIIFSLLLACVSFSSCLLAGEWEFSPMQEWAAFKAKDWETVTPDEISSILKKGSDPHYMDTMGRAPIHHLAAHTSNPETIQVLLNAGANPNAPDIRGNTSLHMLALNPNKDPAIRKVLIDGGADPSIKNYKGKTADSL